MSANTKCQSCGMPLKADPKRGGTDADGRHSQEYCSYCYVDGQFVNPNMTIEEMRALVIEKLQERGFPKFVAKVFAGGLNRLKRWR
jgi:hypothetical protein